MSDKNADIWRFIEWHNMIGKPLREISRLSGAEHEHQYLHGGCPECGIVYNPEWDWQHNDGCSRATTDEPAHTDARSAAVILGAALMNRDH
jgi:hypothetical protein